MDFSTDQIIKTGKSHDICEDYALNGVCELGAYGIVSDGCSGSKDTDIGARLIALAARKHLSLINWDNPEPFGAMVAATAAGWLPDGVPVESLDATLIVAVCDDVFCRVVIFGDGCVLVSRKGETVYYEANYSSGAPYYPSYRLCRKKMDGYKGIAGNVLTLQTKSADCESTEKKDALTPIVLTFEASDTNIVAIATDGITTFCDTMNRPIPTDNYCFDFIAFKNLGGAFLKRRVANGMIRKFERDGITHYDDIAISAIVKVVRGGGCDER